MFNEDEAAFPSGMRIWANLLKLKQKNEKMEQPDHEHCQHAVLGDGPVRLCGYKSYPKLFVLRSDRVERIETKFSFAHGGNAESGTLTDDDGNTYEWGYESRDDGNKIDLRLKEPSGIVWTGTSGYMYGAGFEE